MQDINTNKTEWDLTPFFNSDDDPKMAQKLEEVKKSNYDFINKWKDRTDYQEVPEILSGALNEYEHLEKYYGSTGDEGIYFWLRTHLDQNDPKLKARFNKMVELGIKIDNDIQFFMHRLSKIPASKQQEFLNAACLFPYKHFLEGLFSESKYLLSEPEEKILNLTSTSAYSNWVNMTEGFLLKEEHQILMEDGKKELKPFASIGSLLSSTHKDVRDSANVAFNEILEKHVDTAEAELNSILEFKKVNDTLRGFQRPDAATLLDDDIEVEVVDALLEAVEKRFDLSTRFYELKAKLLGVSKLQYHERNVDYGETDKKYDWNETVSLVNKIFFKLDPKFSEIFKEFVENGRIDVYPKKGKNVLPFFVSFSPVKLDYVLLNHTDELRDVSTVAHEFGHAINSVMSSEKQIGLNSDTPTSTTEVASTFMEDFVLEEIMEESNDELRFSLMMRKLNDDISNIQRQVACYRFEQELHKDYRETGYLSKEHIGKLFQKHMSAYMGDFVEMSKGSENWWVYWIHIRSFFYVYSYASGLLISKSLQGFVKQDHAFIEKVKEFLAAGSSDSPRNIFMKLGIDIADKNFWNKGLDEIAELLSETEKLAKKLKKIN